MMLRNRNKTKGGRLQPFHLNSAEERTKYAYPKGGDVLHLSLAEGGEPPGFARVLLREGGSHERLPPRRRPILLDVRLGADESKHISFPYPALFRGGVTIEAAAGVVQGSIQTA
jgi:hypothetical protein